MTFIMYLFLVCFVLGVVAVASNPSPYFAALGLVVVSGMGCGVLLGHSGPFLSLVLFLVYLGGMLVVFAYSAALAAEPYPETWGSWPVMVYMTTYIVGVVSSAGYFWGGWYEASWIPADEMNELSLFRADVGGVGAIYGSGGWLLAISVWVLLLTLFVVLEVTRGLSRGTLRAV
uniref:NADH-ubiquinone oxidoreductase chain 6 n=1 Tax=Eleutheronema rhadinum TaxID=1367094 RepID=A0A8E6U226_9TELE|nr:NADH dehydrogenase subunit 6 [Eleutheronema rhadinum]UAT98238.1 NADH dehydrogenase subunit 6 [Eleutheronema rhadinum]